MTYPETLINGVSKDLNLHSNYTPIYWAFPDNLPPLAPLSQHLLFVVTEDGI